MFPFYNNRRSTLSRDDVLAIQSLYGIRKPIIITPNSNTTTLTKPTSTTSFSPSLVKPNLCNIKNLNTFVIINQQLYIFYKKFFWVVQLEDKTFGETQTISDWLFFLPPDFEKIDFIYLKPNGQVVLIINKQIYLVEFPSLKLVYGYPISTKKFDSRQNLTINGIVNTYLGRTILFFNDNYYMDIDECTFSPIRYGITYKTFFGLPESVDSVFRYTNGLLYFFKNSSVFVYDEFVNSILRVEKNDLSIFGIKCLKSETNNTSILAQIRNLIDAHLINSNRQ